MMMLDLFLKMMPREGAQNLTIAWQWDQEKMQLNLFVTEPPTQPGKPGKQFAAVAIRPNLENLP
jgi:hypothetical protein